MTSLFDTEAVPATYVQDAELTAKKGCESARLTLSHIENVWTSPKKAESGVPLQMFDEIPAIAPDAKGQTSLF